MIKRKILVILLFCFLVLLFFSIAFYHKEVIKMKNLEFEKLKSSDFSEICFENFCFEIEKAKTKEERRKGLMFRESLAENKGMLFDFKEESTHGIWMKNTVIFLDIIWLNKDFEIVFIKENIPPCKQDPCPVYKNNTPARYVLEINAGKTKELGLKIGDKLKIK